MKHERNLPKTAEAAFTLADDSTIEHLAPACSPRLFFCALKMHFTTLRALAIYPNCTKYLRKVTLQHHQILPLPRKVTLQHHQIQMMRLPRNVTFEHHQILRLPRKVTVRCVTHMIENVTCIGRSKRCDHPTSPKNIAPARKITLMIDPRHI